MDFIVWLWCFLTSKKPDERLTAKIHLRSKLHSKMLKAMNFFRKRHRCPECGRHPAIWGRPRLSYFCGCGHCGLYCQGHVMKEVIHDWNARKNLNKNGKKLSRVVVARPYDGIPINTEMEYLLDDDNDLLFFNNEYNAKAYLLEHGCGEDELAMMRFEEAADVIDGNSDHIKIQGHVGTWYVIDERDTELHGKLFLLEHETYGDEAACLIVNGDGEVILGGVWNGFLDYDEWLAGQSAVT